ncbi:MAG: hypothetical protein AAF405_04085 [Pseudomonadota bacterium]
MIKLCSRLMLGAALALGFALLPGAPDALADPMSDSSEAEGADAGSGGGGGPGVESPIAEAEESGEKASGAAPGGGGPGAASPIEEAEEGN